MNNDFEKNPILKLKVKKKKMIIHNLKPKNKKKNFRRFFIISLFLFPFLLIISFLLYNIILIIFKKNNLVSSYLSQSSYQQDDLTLVTAYYRIKSKHTPEEYLAWIKKFVLLNKSIVFFSNKEFMPTLKELRPIELHKKSVFIEIEMEDFYSYKNFFDSFTELYKDDFEKNIHNVLLYTIWAEKCTFLKKAITQNYFRSKCFYWIDIGYFSDDNVNMTNLINDWPKLDQCFGDEKIIMGTVRNYTESEKENFVKFDPGEHYRFPRTINTCGCFFGGQIKNTLKFIEYYYDAVREFIKRKIFCGKEQTVFAYVAFAHPEVIKLIYMKIYKGFVSYLS